MVIDTSVCHWLPVWEDVEKSEDADGGRLVAPGEEVPLE